MKEFYFIRRYLAKLTYEDDVILGIGDDAAIIRPKTNVDWCFSSDMLLAGRHFFEDVAASDLAYKILAVNLSDMAAMGAKPRWVLLSAALPELKEEWLNDFCSSLFSTAKKHGISLIGGDTTKGNYVFNVTIAGELPRGKALKRSDAQIGDEIWVSGQLGLAAAALNHHWQKIILPKDVFEICEQARLHPIPRVSLGQHLLTFAHAAQDVSDGLAQDIGHILSASNVGAEIWVDKIPTYFALKQSLPTKLLYEYVLSGGDDYELIFTASAKHHQQVLDAGQRSGTQVTCIGRITDSGKLTIKSMHDDDIQLTTLGFDHFGSQ